MRSTLNFEVKKLKIWSTNEVLPNTKFYPKLRIGLGPRHWDDTQTHTF